MRREPGGAPGVRVSVRARAHTRGRGQGAGRGERPEPALPARSPGSRGPGAGAERTDGQTDRLSVGQPEEPCPLAGWSPGLPVMRCPPGRLAERLEPASAGGEHVQGAAQQDSGEGCAVKRPVVGKRYLSVRPSRVRCELGAGLPARPAEPRGQQGLSRAGRALCAQEGAG